MGGFDERYVKLVLNFSAQTSSNNVQDIIEGRLEKRTKGTFGPPGGRKMIAMIDDLNMPVKARKFFLRLVLCSAHTLTP